MAKRIGPMVNRLYALKLESDSAAALAKKIKDKYEKFRLAVRAELNKQELDHAGGDLANVSLTQTESATITDYKKLETYIYRNKKLHLLTKVPSTAAWRDIVEERKGRPIPGMSSYNRIGMRVTKRR